MKKEEIVALGVADDVAQKIVEMAKAEIDASYTTKERFNDVNEAKKKAEALVKERDEQLETLKKSAGDSEALQKQIADLQAANAEAAKEHEKAMKQLKRESIDSALLTEAGAKNAKAVSALFDALDEGLSEDAYKAERQKQLEAIKKDNEYLFESANPQIKGVVPGKNGNPPQGANSFEARYAEAKKNGNTLEQISIKQEAFKEGVILN